MEVEHGAGITLAVLSETVGGVTYRLWRAVEQIASPQMQQTATLEGRQPDADQSLLVPA